MSFPNKALFSEFIDDSNTRAIRILPVVADSTTTGVSQSRPQHRSSDIATDKTGKPDVIWIVE